LAAEQITTMVICGGRLGAGHGRPARMSESHAGIFSNHSFTDSSSVFYKKLTAKC